jgi:sodium transport system permease protein
VFCGVLLLMIRFFISFLIPAPNSWPELATSTVVALLAFVAAPALLMTVMLTRSPRRTLLLRMPRPAALPMAVLLAVVIHPLGVALAEAVKRLYPFNEDVLRQLQGFGGLLSEAPHLWAVLAVLALAPAICEELAFRGFILSGLRHMGHRWGAIVASSIFFGAAHGILQQSLAACAVGIVIGYLAVQTGSVLPGMLFHFVYNSMSLLMALALPDVIGDHTLLDWLYVVEDGSVAYYHWPAVVGSLLLSAALMSWFRSLPHEVSAEEALQDALDHQSPQPTV